MISHRQKNFLHCSFRCLRAVLLTTSLLLSACGGDATPTPAANPVIVESGVAPLTPLTARSGDDAQTEAGASSPDDAATTTPTEGEAGAADATSGGFPLLNVGDEVVARGILRIYAAAEPNAPTLDEYRAGDRFTILGPPDDVTIYPVELAGVRWYRVRAVDGLVGWVIADGIEPLARP